MYTNHIVLHYRCDSKTVSPHMLIPSNSSLAVSKGRTTMPSKAPTKAHLTQGLAAAQAQIKSWGPSCVGTRLVLHPIMLLSCLLHLQQYRRLPFKTKSLCRLALRKSTSAIRRQKSRISAFTSVFASAVVGTTAASTDHVRIPLGGRICKPLKSH